MAFDAERVRAELLELAGRRCQVLVQERSEARPVVSALLTGRVRFRPVERRRWEMKGTGTLAGLFTREIFPSVWRPHRDSNPGFSLERAAS